MNHYELLGVSRTASAEEIRLAYKRKANAFHPDKNSAANAVALFQEVRAAYDTLRDPAKRAAYDGIQAAPGLMTQAQVDAASATAQPGGPCPVCHGAGELRTPDLSKNGRILFWSNKPCPRGCKKGDK